jgi:hypothetical protein
VSDNVSDKRMQRYSISVSGETYERLRSAVQGSMAAFVDEIVLAALNDPAILARVVPQCRPKPPKVSAP